MTASQTQTNSLVAFTVLVDDYDQAIAWYCEAFGFAVRKDERRDNNDRWVELSYGADGPALRLAVARNEDEKKLLGRQAGSRVLLVVHTDDIAGDIARFRSQGVTVTESLREEAYGSVIVATDLYGNRWDFIQPLSVSTADRSIPS